MSIVILHIASPVKITNISILRLKDVLFVVVFIVLPAISVSWVPFNLCHNPTLSRIPNRFLSNLFNLFNLFDLLYPAFNRFPMYQLQLDLLQSQHLSLFLFHQCSQFLLQSLSLRNLTESSQSLMFLLLQLHQHLNPSQSSRLLFQYNLSNPSQLLLLSLSQSSPYLLSQTSTHLITLFSVHTTWTITKTNNVPWVILNNFVSSPRLMLLARSNVLLVMMLIYPISICLKIFVLDVLTDIPILASWDSVSVPKSKNQFLWVT